VRVIRDELPEDGAALAQLHRRAFDGDLEARIVELLRSRGKAVASLVALRDGDHDREAAARVAGHVMFSPVTFPGTARAPRAVGLGPLAVLPEVQRTGIGSQLVREGLRRCTMAGFEAAVVLGHPVYYGRFGFRPASSYGLVDEYGGGAAFMALELRPGVFEGVTGIVRYAPEFDEATSGGASPEPPPRSR
jgi:putative acetyltransferase